MKLPVLWAVLYFVVYERCFRVGDLFTLGQHSSSILRTPRFEKDSEKRRLTVMRRSSSSGGYNQIVVDTTTNMHGGSVVSSKTTVKTGGAPAQGVIQPRRGCNRTLGCGIAGPRQRQQQQQEAIEQLVSATKDMHSELQQQQRTIDTVLHSGMGTPTTPVLNTYNYHNSSVQHQQPYHMNPTANIPYYTPAPGSTSFPAFPPTSQQISPNNYNPMTDYYRTQVNPMAPAQQASNNCFAQNGSRIPNCNNSLPPYYQNSNQPQNIERPRNY